MQQAWHKKGTRDAMLRVFLLLGLALTPIQILFPGLVYTQTAGSTPPLILQSEEPTYLPKDFALKHKPPIILAVDGFCKRAELLPKYECLTEYLKKALEKSPNIKGMNGEIKTFHWTGDTKDTPLAVDDLKRSILHAVEVSRNDQRTLAIVAHSWGGALVYEALHELEVLEKQLSSADIDLFITLGTPLNAQQEHSGVGIGVEAKERVEKYIAAARAELNKPTSVRTWINYWTLVDNISGPIGVADNVELSNVQFGDHSSYYQNSAFREIIGAEIVAAVIKRTLGQIAVAECNRLASYPQVQHEHLDAVAAEQACAKAIQWRPSDAALHVQLGRALFKLKRNEDALRANGEAIRLQPHYALAHFGLASILAWMNRHEEAIIAYREAINLMPNLPEAHYGLGVSLQLLNRQEEAVRSYQEAIRLKPDYAFAYYGLGSALSWLNRPEEAIPAFQEAIRLKPDYPEAQQGLRWAQGRVKEAQATVAKVPSTPGATTTRSVTTRFSPDCSTGSTKGATASGGNAYINEAGVYSLNAMSYLSVDISAQHSRNFALAIFGPPNVMTLTWISQQKGDQPIVNPDGTATFFLKDPSNGIYSGPATQGRMTIRLISARVDVNPLCEIGKRITGSFTATFQRDDGSPLSLSGEFSMFRTR